MGCTELLIGDQVVTICAPTPTWRRRVVECPTCKRRRRFVQACFEWYDPIWTCCACGDSFSGGERMSRPFAPAWRPKAIAKARERWRAA
jgi:ribosomal protein L37AE/L43A